MPLLIDDENDDTYEGECQCDYCLSEIDEDAPRPRRWWDAIVDVGVIVALLGFAVVFVTLIANVLHHLFGN